jgi:predicted nucleic acid-binding Zn ribbon protein
MSRRALGLSCGDSRFGLLLQDLQAATDLWHLNTRRSLREAYQRREGFHTTLPDYERLQAGRDGPTAGIRSLSHVAQPSKPQVPAEAERSAVVGSPQPVCAVSGGPRDPRKREACSDRCRAALSRRRRAQTQMTREQALRTLLEEALRRLGEDA